MKTIEKMYNGVVPNGKVLNMKSNSQTDTYSCDIINSLLPIGMITPFSGLESPNGWLICDGRAVSRLTYPLLFQVIGTTYGEGDGSTTFNLPDLKGKVIVGLDIVDIDFNVLGHTGGEKEHTLTVEELAKHRHSAIYLGGEFPIKGWATLDTNGVSAYNITSTTTKVKDINNTTTAYNGGGQAHNNMPPYITMNYIIKADI